MKDFLFWLGMAQVFFGMLVIFAGKFWHYGAHFLQLVFEFNVDPDKGTWVALAGLVMFLAGFGLCYFAVNYL